MINQSIAHYKITAKIGAGGMGEVYRATDTKLGRDVALKVLPEAFAADTQRMQRFQREAQVLASLNHPNIAAIYGIETADVGASFSSPPSPTKPGGPAEGGPHKAFALAMELVEGPTLAERIAQGAIPIEDALPIARQIAEALEYAHEHGIIHRDLKPANIKITPDGQVKVLDFGLAKALTEDGAPADVATSPTLSMAATKAGIILGTAAYMSPEQARGKSVDRRTDIWAFGVVLFEMLTGRQMFSGETVTDVMAAVVRAEPDWTLLPAKVPAHIKKLLHRCLEKDARKRLRDIGEARLTLEEPPEPAAPAPVEAGAPAKRAGFAAFFPWALAALLGVTAVALILRTGPSQTAEAPVRFSISMPEKSQLVRADTPILAISSDGSKVVFVADPGSGPQLFVRPMDRLDATPLAGTGGASSPFFSPDGRWIGFFADGKLKKIALTSAQSVTLADAPVNRGGAWSADDSIYYSPRLESGLMRVPASGGAPEEVTKVDRQGGERTHRWPTVLPNGDVLFIAGLASSPGNYDDASIGIYSRREGKALPLKIHGAYARYVRPGTLLVSRAGSIFAIPMSLSDPAAAVPEGSSLFLEAVAGEASSGATYFDVAQNGGVAFVPAEALPSELSMVLMDRKGAETLLPLHAGNYNQPRFAPDGKRLAYNLGGRGSDAEVWTYDLQSRNPQRFTFTPGTAKLRPIWSPDGKKLVYTQQSTGKEGLLWRPSDGSGAEEEFYVSGSTVVIANDWSRDGKWLAFTEYPAGGICVISLADHKVTRIEDNAFEASFSPDSRWVAYSSNRDSPGQAQVFVRGFPAGGKWQVSIEGGAIPRWSRDGKELFFVNGDRMMVADISPGAAFKAGPPRVLFSGPFVNTLPLGNYDVSADGRFAIVRSAAAKTPGRIEVVLHWKTELEAATANLKK